MPQGAPKEEGAQNRPKKIEATNLQIWNKPLKFYFYRGRI